MLLGVAGHGGVAMREAVTAGRHSTAPKLLSLQLYFLCMQSRAFLEITKISRNCVIARMRDVPSFSALVVAVCK